MTEPEKRTLQQSLRETWMHALGAVSGAPGEVAKAAQRMLESLGLKADEAGEREGPIGELYARVKRNREALERRVDEGVRSAVQRVRQPIVQEIAQLRGRVERLQRSLEEFRRRREGGAKGA
jgi:hypothetical protein